MKALGIPSSEISEPSPKSNAYSILQYEQVNGHQTMRASCTWHLRKSHITAVLETAVLLLSTGKFGKTTAYNCSITSSWTGKWRLRCDKANELVKLKSSENIFGCYFVAT
jgi:hypothetical protein